MCAQAAGPSQGRSDATSTEDELKATTRSESTVLPRVGDPSGAVAVKFLEWGRQRLVDTIPLLS